MEPFDAYDYFKTIISAVGINSIRRCSGIINIEEILASPGSLKPPVLVVEDNDSGFLSLDQGNFDTGYFNIYILKPVKTGDAESAQQARKECKKLMSKLFLHMLEDSDIWADYGCGLDASRIDYAKIGPLASNFHGYSAGFQMNIDFSYAN
jgi:hypothetical protein